MVERFKWILERGNKKKGKDTGENVRGERGRFRCGR